MCPGTLQHRYKKKFWYESATRSIIKLKGQTKRYTIDQICCEYGFTRQAYYKLKSQRKRQLEIEQAIIDIVLRIRKRQPMLGVRKLHKKINDMCRQTTISIGRDRLYSLLRDHDLLISHKKKYVRTTDSYHRFRTYKNLIKNMPIIRPDQVYVSDITYIALVDGYCYLFLITDLFSRKIVGYCLSKSLSIEGCLTALKMALKSVKQPKNLIHHSDRGIQYCSHAYVKLLNQKGIKISMTEENHVYENAVAERVNGILKNEFLLGEKLTSFKIAKKLVSEVIYIYNNERSHLSLNYLTPSEVYNTSNYLQIKEFSSQHNKSECKNKSYNRKVDNSEVTHTQSTSYQHSKHGFLHISEFLSSFKLNNYSFFRRK